MAGVHHRHELQREHCHQAKLHPYFYQVMQAAVVRGQAPQHLTPPPKVVKW
jgi:hypothetical protein